MSTLEKLLVLGVLVLVGVILAISLFWNRPETNGGLRNGSNPIVINGGQPGGPPPANPLPVPPSLANGAVAPNAAGNTNNPNSNVAGTQNGANVDGTLVATSQPASKPAPGNMLLSHPVPSAFVTASPNPDFYVYRVQKGDTPKSVSTKLTGQDSFARVIDRAVEGNPLVPGKSILVPAEIFANVKNAGASQVTNNLADGADRVDNAIKTGPGTSKASGSANDKKSGVSDAAANRSEDVSSSDTTLYTVKKGESLRKIARVVLKDERRWKEIQQLNQMKSDVVRDGQKIKLPAH